MRRGERRGPAGPLGKAALEEQDGPALGLRRSTESEVYDDGTNTFFCMCLNPNCLGCVTSPSCTFPCR
uniref:Uncharacterized protein n=1 Tax=Pavo cristatus TaxID=9049 RepID=A0A8C9G6X4_PAVCR